jgi:Tuberculosis necrotizing toxin
VSSRLRTLRWRASSERGQDVVEYAGLIVLVALLIGALTAVGIPGRISHAVGCGVQQILDGSGGGCGARAASTKGAGVVPARTLVAQPCPVSAGSSPFGAPSPSMESYLSDPRGVTAGGVTLLAPAPPPPGLGCALSGGGAAGGFGPWTAGSGLASTSKQAYALNMEVQSGHMPPMPANWGQMTAGQRTAFECQASQVFTDISCGVGLAGPARLNQSIFTEDTTQTTTRGASALGVLSDLAPLATSALQQLCAPECDANPALDSAETEQDVRAVSDLGAQIAGDAEATTPLAISSADETAAAQSANATAEEEAVGSGPAEITTYYPSNNGFLGPPEEKFLQVGERIDRYGGSDYSRFFSPEGTPESGRALPPGTAGQPLNTYVVAKPFPVESGTVAPGFDSLGGGIQYRTPVPLRVLIERGILVRAP